MRTGRASPKVRRFVVRQQGGRCLLCAFPLNLGGYLHHVIAMDAGGPDHPLNLVGLCPNHHAVLEHARRHLAPKAAFSLTGWTTRAQAALAVIEDLAAERRELFDLLSRPYPYGSDVARDLRPDLVPYLGRDVARTAADLLLRVNLHRPRMLALWKIARRTVPRPQTDADFEALVAGTAGTATYRDVEEPTHHYLHRLSLPFNPDWIA